MVKNSHMLTIPKIRCCGLTVCLSFEDRKLLAVRKTRKMFVNPRNHSISARTFPHSHILAWTTPNHVTFRDHSPRFPFLPFSLPLFQSNAITLGSLSILFYRSTKIALHCFDIFGELRVVNIKL